MNVRRRKKDLSKSKQKRITKTKSTLKSIKIRFESAIMSKNKFFEDNWSKFMDSTKSKTDWYMPNIVSSLSINTQQVITLDTYLEKRKENVMKLKTGFSKLNEVTDGGLSTGGVWLLAGGSGSFLSCG